MKRIQTNPTAQYANASKFQQAADRLRQMERELFHSYVGMDLEIRSKPELGERVYDAIREMQSLAEQLEQMGYFMQTAAARLEDADKQAEVGMEKISSRIQAQKSINANPMQGLNTTALTLWFGGLVEAVALPITTGLGWIRGIINGSSTGKTDQKEPYKTGYIPAAWLQTDTKEAAENSGSVTSSAAASATDKVQASVSGSASSVGWPGNAAYQAPENPYARSGYGGQCTAFVWGRVKEKLGVSLPFTRSARYWWEDKKGLSFGSTPRANAIAVWAGDAANSYGHVAFVESVSGNNITFNEANVSTYNGSQYGGGYDGKPETLDISRFNNRGTGVGQLLGYIYLD